MFTAYTRRMTKKTEDTILSLLRSMDKRMDGMAATLQTHTEKLESHDKKFDLILNILADHSATLKEHTRLLNHHTKLHMQHQGMFRQLLDVIPSEMQFRTDMSDQLDNHEERLVALEAA